MVITETHIVVFCLTFFGVWQYQRRAAWWMKYRAEVIKHAETAEELAANEEQIRSHTATIALATQILDDFQKGRLKREYKTT